MPRIAAPRISRFRIHHDLHEALRFAFFDRAGDSRHGALADQSRAADLADFRLRQTGAPERRIDIARMRECDR